MLNTPCSIREYRIYAAKELEQKSPSPDLDAQVLLRHAFKYDKTQLLLFADNLIPQEKLVWLNNAVEQRKTGLPVAYITGVKEFYGYDFFVTPDVLIPKPDTEILVEHAVEMIMDRLDGEGAEVGVGACVAVGSGAAARLLKICDMCTGSGCIGISVLKTLYTLEKVPVEKLPQLTMVDISEPALAIAKKNAAHLLPDSEILQKINFVQSDLFEKVEGSFDFILTNPPYIPSAMVDELLKDGRNEPRLALDGDMALREPQGPHASGPLADGTFLIKKLLKQSCEHLTNNGTILMETGEYNAQATADFASTLGFTTQLHKDLEGQLRVVEMTHEQ